MNPDWRNEPTTETQKEKLRFFGCTWDEGITAGQASDALEECARQFPDAEAAYHKSQPATEEQKDKLHFFGCTWTGDITVGHASDALLQCAKDFPDREMVWQNKRGESPEAADENLTLPVGHWFPPEPKRSDPKYQAWLNPAGQEYGFALDHMRWKETVKQIKAQIDAETEASQPEVKREGFYPAKSQAADEKREVDAPKESEVASYQSIKEWDEWLALHERLKERQNPSDKTPSQEVTIQKAETSAEPVPPTYLCYPTEPQKSWYSESQYERAYATWRMEDRNVEAENQARCEKYVAAIARWNPKWTEAVKLGESLKIRKLRFARPQNVSLQEVTIQEATKPDNTNPREFTIPARDVQEYAQRNPTIRKPDAYKITAPIERFTKWVDGLLERNQTCLGGHWLPAGSLSYVFATDAITIGLCRQIADTIESKGYCVEPDARFGSGTYDRDQTLALFKPFDGDPIHPSTAYLGAANLLRLCILITTADGQIDLGELDVFRQAIANQSGLTQTDHKRLLILEQLLAQELCSASKTIIKIAKSFSADKRLVIGHLLVQVAAANNVITKDERRALERIFKAFEFPPDTLEKLINQICPWPRHDAVQGDISKRDKWLWKHWRSGHPGVVIDDFTLAEKKWNFNDWKSLNTRWRDLHDRLAALQKNHGTSSGASGEQISRPVAVPAPKDFTLDMERVYQITNETKEVVAILSVVMEDEPENSITLPNTVVVPAPEIPNISSDGKTAPEPARFNGLDATFHPILERLLTRDSWPLPDFNALASEFNFMPLKIRDTLNEWSDEALGDFILDGEDPVVIRRELMAKETTCYG